MLTKSDLLSLRQCPRKLWLEHRHPELIPSDDPTLYRRTTDGRIVGEKAREVLGQNILWPPHAENPIAAAERAITLLRENPGKSAVEVPMVCGGLYARADALIAHEGEYILRETKSSIFPLMKDKVTPDTPEEHHVDDVAIQTWVMEGTGIPKRRSELNLLNNQWRYPGDRDYSGLFRQLNITAAVEGRKAQVPAWIKEAEAVIAGDNPKVSTGGQCKKPYACPFLGHCRTLDPPRPNIT